MLIWYMGNNKVLSFLFRGWIIVWCVKSGWWVVILYVNREFLGLYEKKEKESFI